MERQVEYQTKKHKNLCCSLDPSLHWNWRNITSKTSVKYAMVIFYQKLPNHAYIHREERQTKRGSKSIRDKTRVTVMVCTSAAGEKAPLAVVGYAKRPTSNQILQSKKRLVWPRGDDVVADRCTFSLSTKEVFLCSYFLSTFFVAKLLEQRDYQYSQTYSNTTSSFSQFTVGETTGHLLWSAWVEVKSVITIPWIGMVPFTWMLWSSGFTMSSTTSTTKFHILLGNYCNAKTVRNKTMNAIVEFSLYFAVHFFRKVCR